MAKFLFSKWTERAIAGFVAMVVMLSGGAIHMTALANEGGATLPTGLTLIEGYEDAKGTDLLANGKINWVNGGTGGASAPAVADDAYKGNGNTSAKLCPPTEVKSTDVFIKIPANALTGKTGMIFYVKMPTAAGGNSILLSLGTSASGYVFKDDASIKLLTKESGEWTAKTTGSNILALDSGFEGYVWVDFSQLRKNWGEGFSDNVVDELARLDVLQMYIGTMGGENAFYFDDMIAVDSSYTGSIDFASDDYKKPIGYPEIATGLTLIEGYEDAKAGDDLLLSGDVHFVAGGEGTAVADGTYKGNGDLAAKLHVEELRGNKNSSIAIGANSLIGKDGVIFYIKVPEIYEGDETSVNGILFEIGTKDQSGYVMEDNITIQILPAGVTEWKTLKGGYWTSFPNGFEGYIKLDFSQFRKNWGTGFSNTMTDELEKFNYVQLYVGEMGELKEDGTENALYIDDLMAYDAAYKDVTDFLPEDWEERDSGNVFPGTGDKDEDEDEDFILPGEDDEDDFFSPDDEDGNNNDNNADGSDNAEKDETPDTGVDSLTVVLLMLFTSIAGLVVLKKRVR